MPFLHLDRMRYLLSLFLLTLGRVYHYHEGDTQEKTKPSVEPFDERRSVGKKARCSWHQHLLSGSHAQGWWVGLFTCPARQGILRPMISWYQSRRSRFLMATHYFRLKDLHM